MFWRTTTAGKPMPLDVEPVADGNLYLEGAEFVRVVDLFTPASATRFVSHFVTCPDADEHRKGNS